MTRTIKILSLILAASFLLAACNLPRETATPDPNEPNLIKTYAAQTVQALGTQLAQATSTQPAPATQPVTPSETAPCSDCHFGGYPDAGKYAYLAPTHTNSTSV